MKTRSGRSLSPTSRVGRQTVRRLLQAILDEVRAGRWCRLVLARRRGWLGRLLPWLPDPESRWANERSLAGLALWATRGDHTAYCDLVETLVAALSQCEWSRVGRATRDWFPPDSSDLSLLQDFNDDSRTTANDVAELLARALTVLDSVGV
jgi:hypothetical protein